MNTNPINPQTTPNTGSLLNQTNNNNPKNTGSNIGNGVSGGVADNADVSDGVNGSNSNQKNSSKKKKKIRWKYIIGGTLLVLLLAGVGAGYWLTQQKQDIRQQASTGGCEQYSNKSTCEPAGCTWEGRESDCSQFKTEGACSTYSSCSYRDETKYSCIGYYTETETEKKTYNCSGVPLDECGKGQYASCNERVDFTCSGGTYSIGKCEGSEVCDGKSQQSCTGQCNWVITSSGTCSSLNISECANTQGCTLNDKSVCDGTYTEKKDITVEKECSQLSEDQCKINSQCNYVSSKPASCEGQFISESAGTCSGDLEDEAAGGTGGDTYCTLDPNTACVGNNKSNECVDGTGVNEGYACWILDGNQGQQIIGATDKNVKPDCACPSGYSWMNYEYGSWWCFDTTSTCTPPEGDDTKYSCEPGSCPGTGGPGEPGDGTCNASSASSCQGQNVGDQCADGEGVCKDGDNDGACTCNKKSPEEPVCLSISMDNPNGDTPKIGDQVTFTCGEVPEADHYNFRVKKPDGTFAKLNATGRISEPFPIEEAGNYQAQCQICTDSSDDSCLPWESI
jgi:hypothetical protein